MNEDAKNSPVDGLTTVESEFGPKETLDKLEQEILGKGMKVFARINHAALAEGVGMSLRPTEVILFGNPRGGTPLMQASQTIGINLPLKALVWQDATGKTWLSYEVPSWLAVRHHIHGMDQQVNAMDSALAALVARLGR